MSTSFYLGENVYDFCLSNKNLSKYAEKSKAPKRYNEVFLKKNLCNRRKYASNQITDFIPWH